GRAADRRRHRPSASPDRPLARARPDPDRSRGQRRRGAADRPGQPPVRARPGADRGQGPGRPAVRGSAAVHARGSTVELRAVVAAGRGRARQRVSPWSPGAGEPGVPGRRRPVLFPAPRVDDHRPMDPAHKALAKKVLLGVGGLTVVGVVAVGIYNAVVDRPPKFAVIVAEDLPADTVGMIAFADPAHTLELLDWVISRKLKAELEDQLGFEPFATAGYAELGFDVEQPIGVALVDMQRELFVFSMGITDADKARETIERYSDKLGAPRWQAREFAGLDGLWQDQPPVALLFRND